LSLTWILGVVLFAFANFLHFFIFGSLAVHVDDRCISVSVHSVHVAVHFNVASLGFLATRHYIISGSFFGGGSLLGRYSFSRCSFGRCSFGWCRFSRCSFVRCIFGFSLLDRGIDWGLSFGGGLLSRGLFFSRGLLYGRLFCGCLFLHDLFCGGHFIGFFSVHLVFDDRYNFSNEKNFCLTNLIIISLSTPARSFALKHSKSKCGPR